MINFNKLWKSMKWNGRLKRQIKEVILPEIDIKEYILIDVRSKREYMENHLNGAYNIPLPEIKQTISNIVPDPNSKILVYCQSGVRSKKSVQIMEDMGYTQVYNLKGGLENI